MNTDTFTNISKIIERDSKSTTYKFALLRGTIDIIQDNSPYIKISETIVEIPLGLLIEKWLIYYYPILDSKILIPQINGVNTQLAFQIQFQTIINYYGKVGGLSTFYNDLRIKGISKEVNIQFYDLIKNLKSNIVKNPMCYIGNSLNKSPNSIYKYLNNSTLKNTTIQNAQWLIDGCGTFTIPKEYYNAFKILGSFLAGTDSILFKWAEFSVNASGKKITTEKIINEILKSPITERDISNSKKLYKNVLKNMGEITCVWSGKQIKNYDIDHVIPFSIFKNNDLWNLLPAQPVINNKKRDKIPSIDILHKRKDIIIYYWELINQCHQDTFINELQISLLGNLPKDNWKNSAFTQLLNTSKYLINTRGYEEWKI